MADKNAKTNNIERYLLLSIQWINTHREQFATLVGVTAILIGLVIFLINRKVEAEKTAWMQLADVQGKAFQGQSAQALESLKAWKGNYAGTRASSYATFIEGELLMKTSDYMKAGEVYATVAQSGKPETLKPLGLAGQCTALEMAQKYPEAKSCAEKMVATYPDHYMTGTMLLTQARMSDLLKQSAEAVSLYNRFALLYPDSPWTAYAKNRSTTLGGTVP